MGDLKEDVFLTHVQYIRQDIEGTHERLDTLNGRLRTAEVDIGALKAEIRILKDDSAQLKVPHAERRSPAPWKTIIGGMVAVGGFLKAIWPK